MSVTFGPDRQRGSKRKARFSVWRCLCNPQVLKVILAVARLFDAIARFIDALMKYHF